MESQFALALRKLAPEQRFGAAVIAEIAADALLRRAGMGEAASPDAFRQELLHTGRDIIRTQPGMAPLVNLVSNVMWKVEQVETPREMRQAVADVTNDFKRQLRQHAIHVAEGALALIPDGGVIVTLSLSTTVRYALSHAQRAGRRFSVICAESRPICEGRAMAAALAGMSIPVTLMTDTAALAHVPHAQLALVGADMLTTAGLVNKTGTFALAAAARASRIPFYTLCGSAKLLPSLYQPPERETLDPRDVWDHAQPSLQIVNTRHDRTPLDLISGIVTERGTLPTAAVEAWLAALRLHPTLTTPQSDLVAHLI